MFWISSSRGSASAHGIVILTMSLKSRSPASTPGVPPSDKFRKNSFLLSMMRFKSGLSTHVAAVKMLSRSKGSTAGLPKRIN